MQKLKPSVYLFLILFLIGCTNEQTTEQSNVNTNQTQDSVTNFISTENQINTDSSALIAEANPTPSPSLEPEQTQTDDWDLEEDIPEAKPVTNNDYSSDRDNQPRNQKTDQNPRPQVNPNALFFGGSRRKRPKEVHPQDTDNIKTITIAREYEEEYDYGVGTQGNPLGLGGVGDGSWGTGDQGDGTGQIGNRKLLEKCNLTEVLSSEEKGVAWVYVCVSPAGDVTSARVVRKNNQGKVTTITSSRLRKLAEECAKKYKYEPKDIGTQACGTIPIYFGKE